MEITDIPPHPIKVRSTGVQYASYWILKISVIEYLIIKLVHELQYVIFTILQANHVNLIDAQIKLA